MAEWYLLGNHGLVLACIARQPEITARQIASTVGVTERTAHKIITDLHEADFLQKERVGRRNTYQVNLSHLLRHPTFQGSRPDGTAVTVGDLLRALGTVPPCASSEPQPPSSAQPLHRSGLRSLFRRRARAPEVSHLGHSRTELRSL